MQGSHKSFPTPLLNPMREVGIGGGEPMLWDEGVVVYGVVVKSLNLMSDKLARISRWRWRLARVGSQASLYFL